MWSEAQFRTWPEHRGCARPGASSGGTAVPPARTRIELLQIFLQSEIRHSKIISGNAHVEKVNITAWLRVSARNRPEDGQLRSLQRQALDTPGLEAVRHRRTPGRGRAVVGWNP